MATEERIVGIKELVDRGLREVPPIYVRPPEERPAVCAHDAAKIPVIDLSHLSTQSQSEDQMRKLTVQQIGQACREWGFFQIINHGIEYETIHRLREAAMRFFELPIEERMKYHSQSFRSAVAYSTSFNPKYERTREWRDTLSFNRFPGYCDGFHEAPNICREQLLDYIKGVEALAGKLYKAIFESLGLNDDEIEIMVPKIPRLLMGINYYPPCPNPNLTLGLSGHSDVSCLTILHPDEVPGLQIKHNGSWMSVVPISREAFVINLADQIEILTNGRYKSIEHRVATNGKKERMSIACFFGPKEDTIVAPIPSLLDDKNPPLYKAIKFEDYVKNFSNNRLLSNRGTLEFAKK